MARSPNYPTTDLKKVLDNARKVYKDAGKHAAGREVVLKALGYESVSGASRSALAALRAFGLLSTKGSGDDQVCQLTEKALDVLMDEREESPERDRRIRELALNPKMHRIVWDEYGDELPADAAVEFWLKREQGFTEGGAKDFLRNYRKTVAFAGLKNGGSLGASDEEDGQEGDERPPADNAGGHRAPASASPPPSPAPAGAPPMPATAPGAEVLDLPIPLVSGGTAILRTPRRLSPADFQMLRGMITAILDGCREALVVTPTASTTTPPSSAPADTNLTTLMKAAGLRPGTLVQWTSNGQEQFPKPLPVERLDIHDGKNFVFVEGRATGIPLDEVTAINP